MYISFSDLDKSLCKLIMCKLLMCKLIMCVENMIHPILVRSSVYDLLVFQGKKNACHMNNIRCTNCTYKKKIIYEKQNFDKMYLKAAKCNNN